MARNNAIINSFVTGEACPKFRGRTDTSQYAQSCEETLNMLLYPQGGAGRRPGTQLMGEVLENNGDYPEQVRLFPFSAANGTRFQLLLTDLIPDQLDAGNSRYTWYGVDVSSLSLIRVSYTNTGSVVSDSYYDFANLGIPSGPIDMREIQYAQSGDTMFFVHPNMRPFKIVYVDNGVDPIEFIMSPFPELFGGPQEIGDTYAQMPFQPLVQDTTDTIKVTGSTSPTAGTTYTVEPGSGSDITFTSDWIGRHIRFSAGGVTLVLIVTAYTSPILLTATYDGGDITTSPTTFGSTAGTNYEFGYWDNINGWPRTVTFFESRLVFGGNKNFPDTVWFSQISDINDFEIRRLEQDPDFADPVAASDAFVITLKSELLNQIRWMSPGKNITTGTNQREFVVQGPSQNASIGPTNVQTQAETSQGSAYVQAVRIQNTTVFLERDRRKLRELVYNLDENSFQATDLNIIAEHIANKSALKFSNPLYTNREGYFTQVVFQSVPNGILWCIDNNGKLCGLTRERQQQVLAWHYHEIAGSAQFGGGLYDPQVTSLSVIQTPETTTSKREPDELWMTVRRPVSDGTDTELLFYIERHAREWAQATIEGGWGDFTTLNGDTAAPIYMDCAVLIQDFDPDDVGSLQNTGILHDLPHGVGQTVSVVVNGFYLGEFVIQSAMNGSIDISTQVEYFMTNDILMKVIVGFNYNADLVPSVQELPAPTGTSMGQPRRTDQLTVHFNRTIAAQYGTPLPSDESDTPAYNMEDFAFGVPPENGSTPIQMYTGDKKVVFAKGYSGRPRVLIRSNTPLPMEITHMVLRGVVYE